MVRDEIEKLECEHGYHVECVKQWLKVKNWCEGVDKDRSKMF